MRCDDERGAISGRTGLFERDTLVLTAAGYSEVLDLDYPDGGPMVHTGFTGEYVVDASAITFEIECPTTGSQSFAYETDGGSLTILSRGNPYSNISVYSAQF